VTLAPLIFARLASFASLDSDLVKGLCTIPSSSFGVWLCNTIYYARFWDWLLAGCILTILGFGVAVCLLDTLLEFCAGYTSSPFLIIFRIMIRSNPCKQSGNTSIWQSQLQSIYLSPLS
jgi:hypothetical protein